MLWLDGVYEPVAARPDKPRLRRARAPTSAQLTHLAEKIAHRVCRHLARKGWLEGEDESAFLSDSAGCERSSFQFATWLCCGRRPAFRERSFSKLTVLRPDPEPRASF